MRFKTSLDGLIASLPQIVVVTMSRGLDELGYEALVMASG